MTQEIQPYRPNEPEQPLGFPQPLPEFAAPAEAEPGTTLSLGNAVRRRWVTILLVAAVVMGAGLPYVWRTYQITYRATAQIQLSPSQTRILYSDENTGVMPLYDRFLNTQRDRIFSRQVLEAALAEPSVRDLPIRQTADPVLMLRRALAVENPMGTFLLEIGVTQLDPDHAVRLTGAVMQAYRTQVVEAEESDQAATRAILERKRAGLQERQTQQRQQLRALAEQYGTSSEAMLETLRQQLVQANLDTHKELARTDMELITLREQLGQLAEGTLAGTLPAEERPNREAEIARDPLVQQLDFQLRSERARLLELRSTMSMPDDHRAVVSTRERIALLTEQLEKEWDRAAADVDAHIAEWTTRRLKEKKLALEQQLQLAERRREALAQKVEAQEAEGMAIGRRSLEIQSAQQEIEATQQDLDVVSQRIKQLDTESQRPTRVTVASLPEVRPEGISDGRRKRSAMVVVAALFLGVFAALARELLDQSLRGPGQVETITGLPVLGAVPCLSELKSGRVTQEDFIESYRVVRAALGRFGDRGQPPQTLLVTSAQAGEGKTSLAVSLAASLAEPGGRVLLIDGDAQAPQIARLLKLPHGDAVREVLAGQRPLSTATVSSPLRGVDVLVAEPSDGRGRSCLEGGSASRLLADARALYDHVVIDTPPALGAADAMVWAGVVDGVVLSSLTGHTDTTAIRLACERLRHVSARLLGAVVGNVPLKETYYSVSSSRSTYETRGWALTTARRRREPPLVHLPPDANEEP